MNIFQRIVLICGAIALVVALWTAPVMEIPAGGEIPIPGSTGHLRQIFMLGIDLRAVLVRSTGVIGGTLLVFFALKGLKFKKAE